MDKRTEAALEQLALRAVDAELTAARLVVMQVHGSTEVERDAQAAIVAGKLALLRMAFVALEDARLLDESDELERQAEERREYAEQERAERFDWEAA